MGLLLHKLHVSCHSDVGAGHYRNTLFCIQRLHLSYDGEFARYAHGNGKQRIQRLYVVVEHCVARSLVETYAVKVDPGLHSEVLTRYKKLNLAPYKGFVNPRYDAVIDEQGNIVDVQVTYDEGYAEQMLRYSRDYSPLPSIND